MKLIAHRGMHTAGIAENSHYALVGVLASVADGVEVDVRILVDDVCVLHHDVLTTHGEVVANKTFAEAREQNPGLMKLSDALNVVSNYDGLINIEIKHHLGEKDRSRGYACVDQVIDIVKQANVHVVLSSFSMTNIARCQRLAPDIDRAFLVPSYVPVLLAGIFSRRLKCKAIHLSTRQLSTFSARLVVASAHRKGQSIRVYTVNTQSDYRRCEKRGVDAVFTDFIAELDDLR